MPMNVDELSGGTENIDTVDTSNVEDNGGTRQAGTDEQPSDIRSLLTNAFKEDEAGRLRDQSGRFAKAENQPVQGEQAPAGTPAPGTPPVAPQAPSAPPEEAAFLSSLAPEVRPQVEALLQARETAYSQHVQQLNDRLNGYEPIGQVIGNRVQAWAANGWHPAQAIDQLLQLSDFAGRDPAQFVQWFAGQHGLDLATLEDANTYEPDPYVTRLEQRLAQIESGLSQRQQQEIHQQQQHTYNEVQQFAREVDASGAPVRPFFAEVATDLMQMIPSIRDANPNKPNAAILQEAYDRAVWANPSTRSRLLEQQAAQKTAEQVQRVAKARNAGSSIAGAPVNGVTGGSSAPAGSIRDELRRAFAAHS